MRFFCVFLVLTIGASFIIAAPGTVYTHPKPHKAKKHKVPKHRTVLV